jgi:hypothetical protein
VTVVDVPQPPPLVNVYDVELVHTGTWDISTGRWTATRDDLLSAVAALDCPAVRRPVIKLGHTDPRFDGEPAVGWVGNLATARDGSVLTGNYMGLPAWLGARDAAGNSVLSSAYPDRSVEGVYDFRCQLGHTHPFVLTAVALLGVTPPGVGTLQSLQDVAALYGVAAAGPPSGTPVAALIRASTTTDAAAGGRERPMPNPQPRTVAAGVTTEDVRRAYYDDAKWSMWITEIHLEPLQLIVVDDDSGEHFRVPVTVTGEDTFTFGDPVEVLVRYVDAPPDAEDNGEPVGASAQPVVYASRAESRPDTRPRASEPAHAEGSSAEPDEPVVEKPEADEPEPEPDVQPEPPAPADPAAEPEPTTENEEGDDMSLSEVASRLGLDDGADKDAVLAKLDEVLQPKPDPVAAAAAADRDQKFAAALGQIDVLSTELAQIKAEKAQQHKETFFAAAVQAGKLRPADRAAWEARYDQAPEVITEIVSAMAPGSAVPVSAAGYVADPEPAFDDADLMALMPPSMVDAMKGGN